MSVSVRAIRGATTVDADTREQVTSRVQELVNRMIGDNELVHDDLISILFTATEDIRSMFPAAAARGLGLGDVPLLCARELSVDGATPLCIRVLMHVGAERSLAELHHVYLWNARGLRDDLPG
jgi:chorismate mutase